VSYQEQSLKSGAVRLSEMAEQLALSHHVLSEAKEVFMKFEKLRKKRMHGAKKDSLILAILFLACKQTQTGRRTFKEFSDLTAVSEREIIKSYKDVTKLLASTSSAELPQQSAQSTAEDLVDRFCSKLSLPFKFIKFVKTVCRVAAGFLEGKRPATIAGSAILYVGKLISADFVSEKDIAEACGVSGATLRNTRKELQLHADTLLPSNFGPHSIN